MLLILNNLNKTTMTAKLKNIISVIIISFAGIITSYSQNMNGSDNILLNPMFDFHSFINHRDGIPVSFSSHNVAFWNTATWGDIEVIRESHVPENVRPIFSTHNLVAINPGKKIWQFFTLPEAGLAHGEQLNLSVYGYQVKGNLIKAKIKLMKLDSEDGEWSPKDFGMRDSRTFPRHSRGELVIAKEYNICNNKSGNVELIIKNALITGSKSEGNKSSSKDCNTIGIQVEFENTGTSDTVWIYSPKLFVKRSDANVVSAPREMTPYYRNIPRTIQKLWKGEPIHIIVMGSSIDRGSANPPMYLYDEDQGSKSFKQPIAEGLFDASKTGEASLDGYFGEWRHYFSYTGRLKLELMRKYNLTADKICLNFMACDGSSVGEAHSGLKEYCSLSIAPDPEMNGHKKGKSWKELSPDEVAVFEGAIRWIQQHYQNTEFLFCQFQNMGEYTSNPGDMQALSLRYQIPYLDFGKTADDITRWCNQYSLVPVDGHPQAAGHYLWFKQLEKAFECWDPIVPGQVQIQLPERIHRNTYGWEGEMVRFDTTSNRIRINRFIFEDNAINCWGKVDTDTPFAYVDGVKMRSRRLSPRRDIRNSMFRYGRCSLGDRHILEITGENARLTFVDSKINPNRRFFCVDNPNWTIPGISVQDFISEWGSPYGTKKIILEPGKSAEIEVICTDLSIAYADNPDGGKLEIFIDNIQKLSQPTNLSFVDTDKKENFLENRKGILNLGYGLHRVRLMSTGAPVTVLGLFTYDSRSNRDSERHIDGIAKGGEVVEFSLPFKSRPLVICNGGLTVRSEDITETKIKFSGTSGNYQIIGE
jgi:hypothetical protein